MYAHTGLFYRATLWQYSPYRERGVGSWASDALVAGHVG